MTHTHAACKLLEHGPLTYAEFMEFTGWKKTTMDRAIERLLEQKRIYFVNLTRRRRHYALASWKPSESFTPSTQTTQTGHLTNTQGICHG